MVYSMGTVEKCTDVQPVFSIRVSICVGHYPQTRLFAPAATFARVQHRNILQGLTSPPLLVKPAETSILAHCVGCLQNFCFRKRPSFLASRRFAQENPTSCSHYLSGFNQCPSFLITSGTVHPLLSHLAGTPKESSNACSTESLSVLVHTGC
jgi:hypothetical protein